MVSPKTQRLTVRTPEGNAFTFQLAGPCTRFLAWAIDLACILLFNSLFSTVLFGLSLISAGLAQAVLILGNFVVSLGYGIFMEWFFRGQTLGKRVLRIRVMDEQGLHLHFSQVVIRNLLRLVDMLPLCYLVGGVACFYSARAQRLGDYAANTIVVRLQPDKAADVAQVAPKKYNSLRDYPHLEARLRQQVAPEEAAIALQTLLRRDQLDTASRASLFLELATHFQSLVSFPDEAVFGMSDEHYVRNVVDSLFASNRELVTTD
jgi:uncharacterized RDD family membrane protein YckC